MLNFSSRVLVSALLVSLVAAFGCGEDDPTEGGDVVFEDVHEVVLIDRDTDEQLGNHYEDHWHGLIEVEAHSGDDEYVSVGIEFYDEAEEPVDVGLGDGDVTYDIELDDDSIAAYDSHSDHFHIWGEDEGSTEIYFDFRDGEDVFFDTRGEGLDVFSDPHEDNGHDHDALEVAHFGLLDRAHDPHAEIADVHDGHWHGDFADGIELDIAAGSDDYDTAAAGDGEAVSLGADVEEDHDGHTHDVELDGDPYELDAEGGDGTVYIDSHGDHVHVVGLEEGHAHVTFQIVDRVDGDVVYETPEFEFDVHE